MIKGLLIKVTIIGNEFRQTFNVSLNLSTIYFAHFSGC